MSLHGRWWSKNELRGELDAILNLVNFARSRIDVDEEAAARKFCDALNRAWNAHGRLAGDSERDSDWSLLKALFTDLPENDATALLRSSELSTLLAVDPPILNHRSLLERGFLGSAGDMPDAVQREAASAHVKLRRRLSDMSKNPSSDEIHAVLVRLADLLYVIRSNLQHGEKFASPDPVRIARDRLVSEKAAKVLDLFFDLLFARPSTSLAAYGALAPGGRLHGELEHLSETWTPAIVRGQLRNGSRPGLIPIPGGAPVPVQLLRDAPGLRTLWARLDQIEGDEYLRVLTPAETDSGEVVVVNLYAARQ